MENIQQYQRAVTPTMTTSADTKVRGKILSYSSRRGGSTVSSETSSGRGQQAQHVPQPGQNQRMPRHSVNGLKSLHIGQSLEISGQSKPVGGNRVRQDIYCSDISKEFQKISSYLPHQDLEPLSDSVPPDGVLFAKFKNRPGSLVVFRLHDERARNPERLNLDRRQLDVCPHLEQEQRLRLLNFQNNNIRLIQNLENLPNLIFLDLYNNKLSTLEGSLSTVRGLRVLMVGKNRISEISNISTLKKLDVLDLHSNDISEIQGLDGLHDLRVLNLAGNCIPTVHNVSMLSSLTELNLRRNNIEQVLELDKLPALQRVFLSHNRLSLEKNILCLYSLKLLIELSLDANPIAEENPEEYRILIIARIPSLKHLDLRRVNEEEKSLARAHLSKRIASYDMYTSSQPDLSHHPNHHQQVFPQQTLSHDEGDMSRLAKGSPSKFPLDPSRVDGGPHGTSDGQQPSGSPTKERYKEFDLPHKESASVKSQEQLFPPSNSDNKNLLPQNAFDLEAIGNNEKSLVVIGENWEWTHSKRMLSSVTETYLRHMKKETIVTKFTTNLAWLPALNSLTLIDNDIRTFADLRVVIRSFAETHGGGIIKHLFIAENPLCQISDFVVRSFISAIFSEVESFNGVTMSTEEKDRSRNIFGRILCRPAQSSVNNSLARLGTVCESEAHRYRSSLDDFPPRVCVLENSWAVNLNDQPCIDYSLCLQDDSYIAAIGSVDNKKTFDKLPPPHVSFPSVGASKKLGQVAEVSLKRGDLEYRYPYKSTPTVLASHASIPTVAPLLPTQLASLSSISNITQLTLQRRNLEDKFHKMFLQSLDSVLMDTIDTLDQYENSLGGPPIAPCLYYAS